MSISGALLVGLAVLPSRSNWRTEKGGENEKLFGERYLLQEMQS